MANEPLALTTPEDRVRLRYWRYRIFAATWLCYAGFYFCRKPFYVAKDALSTTFGWDASLLGLIGTIYLIAYTVGQFIAGVAGTLWGPRLVLLVGMGASVASNIVFGFSDSAITFGIFMGLNGLAQSVGWGNTVGSMATWFRKEERGRVMGLWATCYQFGGVFGTALAALILKVAGFQYSFFTGSLVLFAVMIFFVFNHHNKPEDVGLSFPSGEEDPPVVAQGTSAARGALQRLGWDRKVVATIAIVGTYYFFGKFIRYAIWSWVPFLLARNYGLEGDKAGYVSILFDIFGIAGVIAAGYLSDKYARSRRTGVSILFLVGMFVACWMLYSMGQNNLWIFGIAISAIGFFLYGPDALMTGAAAQDIGNARGATLSAAIINGMGACGGVVQELLIGPMYDKNPDNIGPIFMLLVGSAAAAVVCLAAVRFTKVSDV
jgi:sugar phosphate permease